MPTNGHDNREVPASEITTGDNNNSQVGGLLETMFCIMVFNATLEYSRIFPKSLRKVIEFVLLLQAVLSFVVLVYLHINFSRMQANCLGHVKDVWPRDGILRVEIIRNFQHSHAEQTGTMDELLRKSYEREYKLKHMGEENAKLFKHFTKTNSPEKKGDIDIEQSTEKLVGNKSGETNTNLFNYLSFTDYTYFEVILNSDYIVEYSLEQGFLHLSLSARNRLNIPVMLVTLDPTLCYADSVSQFFLNYFFGYDNLLLSSVKSLAENERNKGFLRNVISKEFKRIDRISKSRSSYILSLFLMVVFTVLISTFMRYVQQQIIVFTVGYSQLNLRLMASSPVLPCFIVGIVLPGLKVLMSEIFNNSTTAFYVILIVCIADQYVTNFCHGPITQKHWLKFFYVYHFSFYAYHFRFNGQFSKLALICSWLFIQHSMVYFYHHYELDVLDLLQRAERLHRRQQLYVHRRRLRQPTGGEQTGPESQPEEPTE